MEMFLAKETMGAFDGVQTHDWQHPSITSQARSPLSHIIDLVKVFICKWRLFSILELKFIFNKNRLTTPAPERIPQLEWKEGYLRDTATNTFGEIDFINVEHTGGKKPAKVNMKLL